MRKVVLPSGVVVWSTTRVDVTQTWTQTHATIFIFQIDKKINKLNLSLHNYGLLCLGLFCGSLSFSHLVYITLPKLLTFSFQPLTCMTFETCHKFTLERIYLGRLWRSLQDECTNTLLVPVVVHYDERMWQPRCCEQSRKFCHQIQKVRESDVLIVQSSLLKHVQKHCMRCSYWRHLAGQCSWAAVDPERWADREPWRCIPPSAAGPSPGSAAASGDSAQNWQTSAHKVRAKKGTKFSYMNFSPEHLPQVQNRTRWVHTFLILFIFVISRNSSNRNR